MTNHQSDDVSLRWVNFPLLRGRSIGSKLRRGLGVLFLLVLVTGGVSLLGLLRVEAELESAIDHGLEIERLANRVETSLLQARRREKDFLLRWRTEGVEQARENYVAKHAESVAEVLNLADAMQANIEEHGATQATHLLGHLDGLRRELGTYQVEFSQLVELIQIVGVKDTGVVGEFRTAIHKLEATLLDNSDLASSEATLLRLRRHEKDFLLRADPVYIRQAQETAAQLRGELDTALAGTDSRTSVLMLLDGYLTGFERVVELSTEMETRSSVFRKASHEIERSSHEFAVAGRTEGHDQIANAEAICENTLLTCGAIVIATLLLGIVTAYVLAQNLTVPIQLLSDTATQVAAGDLNNQAPVVSDDEIGHFATTFNGMNDRLRETIEALDAERATSEKLLLNILPSAIAARLKDHEGQIADRFEQVTVLFADMVGFTKLSARLTPSELVGRLNTIFSAFDQLTDVHGVEKIKTLGDAYMVVGGLPEAHDHHAEDIAEMALSMQQALVEFNETNAERIDMRIGINSGPVVAGVIGTKKYIYDLWGDAVNVASRMESHGVVGNIQCAPTTQELLQDSYEFELRGEIEVKGKGPMTTWLLKGRKP